MPGVDECILEQNTSGGSIAQRIFCADEAILKVHDKNRRAGAGLNPSADYGVVRRIGASDWRFPPLAKNVSYEIGHQC